MLTVRTVSRRTVTRDVLRILATRKASRELQNVGHVAGFDRLRQFRRGACGGERRTWGKQGQMFAKMREVMIGLRPLVEEMHSLVRYNKDYAGKTLKITNENPYML
jgi:hypothetical protein